MHILLYICFVYKFVLVIERIVLFAKMFRNMRPPPAEGKLRMGQEKWNCQKKCEGGRKKHADKYVYKQKQVY